MIHTDNPNNLPIPTIPHYYYSHSHNDHATQVMEMLMVQSGKVFCEAVASEEWARRLGKLILHTKEPILRMTVLQHLADWIEMFAPITDVKWLVDKGNELGREGHTLPRPSPNARAHSARLLALNEQEVHVHASTQKTLESHQKS